MLYIYTVSIYLHQQNRVVNCQLSLPLYLLLSFSQGHSEFAHENTKIKMSTIYIDEASGTDEQGTGTQNAPYKTLAYALFKHEDPSTPASTTTYQSRKSGETPYDAPTDSALKKAKKGAEGLRKKAAKAAEIAEREAKERADADRRLEESKKIVLVEDESLPQAVKVRIFVYVCCIVLCCMMGTSGVCKVYAPHISSFDLPYYSFRYIQIRIENMSLYHFFRCLSRS